MSSNVGLSTPRGSGTSGYVQRNLSHPKPRQKPYPTLDELHATPKHKPRVADPEILEHDRRRKIESKVLELRDRLEEKGELGEDEIDEKCDVLREELERQEAKGKGGVSVGAGGEKRQLKSWQTHELAEAKGVEDERMRRALGIRKDYEEGGHWKRQEERLRQGVPERAERREEVRKGADRRREQSSDSESGSEGEKADD